MNKLITGLCFLGCLSFNVHATHTGRIFVDSNRNGIFDRGEKSLKGVSVSDGLNVVKSGVDGSFSLSGHSKERFIFITTPSGYRSDNKHYRKIADHKGNFDFGLQMNSDRIKKDGSHKFVHISDTEIFNTENNEVWAGNIRDYAANEKVAFIIHTGDICYDNGLKSHIRLMNTANMDCPMFFCIGNHDLVKGAYGEELFESLYGPVYYSFDMGNVHYIVTPMLGGDYTPGYKKEDVYRWMKNDLALVGKDKSVMVFNHDLLTNKDQFNYGINEKEFINLNEHNLKAWIFGHWHINYIKKQGEVYAVSTAALDKGGIDHSTSAFRVMHVDGKGDFASELRYSYLNKSIRIASLVNEKVPVLPSGAVPLSVNAYSTVSPVKEITYSCFVNDRQVVSQKHMKQQTDWNWYAEIPLSVSKQDVTIRVKALFNNGEVAETEGRFTYPSVEKMSVKLGKDWNNLLGNAQHIGIVSDTLKTPLSLAWIKNVGAAIFMSSPLIYHGNVYVATVDENLQGDGAIFALDGLSGKQLWRSPVRNSIKNTIVAEQGLVFAQDAEGYLYAIDALSGKISWEKKLAVNSLPALIEGLVVSEGIVYAGTGLGLCAVDCKTGKTVWTNTEWKQHEGATTTWAVGENVLVSGSQWGALYGNDISTGKMLWGNSQNGLSDRGASAAIHNGLLYIISRSSLFIMEANSGNVIVRKDLPFKVDVTSTPLVTDKEIVFGSSQSGMVALDRETLDVKWKFETGAALVYTAPYTRTPSASIETSPVLSGSTIYVGASDGTIYGIDKETGRLIWKHSTGAPVFATVAVSGNTLISVDFSGNVYAFIADK
ncbi:MAG: PQQ-binding-like beta-propeller repeat protein [Tannerellaceae bacterium]|nr:PQQ-binding-like beta-propeller repeat protein [Tannerellaceae bacterium]